MRFNFRFFIVAVLSAAAVYWCASPRPPSSDRCDTHGATAAAFEGNPFVAATNGILFACACLCVFVCHPEHNPDDCNLHFPTFSKAPVQYTRHPNSNNGTTSSELHIGSCTNHMYEDTSVLPLCNLRHPPGFKSTTSRRGTL